MYKGEKGKKKKGEVKVCFNLKVNAWIDHPKYSSEFIYVCTFLSKSISFQGPQIKNIEYVALPFSLVSLLFNQFEVDMHNSNKLINTQINKKKKCVSSNCFFRVFTVLQ